VNVVDGERNEGRHGSGGRENGGELLGGRPAVEGHREAQVVVDLLPVPDRLRRFLEAGKLVATPELLVIDPVATLNLAVLLRPARPDVPVADPRLLDTQREGQGELGAVVKYEGM
jgi:hypothetical protein